MEWVKPFRVYRVTGRLVPGPQPDANVHKEFITDIDDIGAVCDFISEKLVNDPTGQARWQVYDAEGARVSSHDYEMMPDGQFAIIGREDQRVTVRFGGWDIFNYWWECVNIEVVSEDFYGKGHDYYLSRTNIFNIANQTLLVVEGQRDVFDDIIAVGALRFSITSHGAKPFEVSGTLRSWPNHGKQRLEFSFNSDPIQLETTASQIREVLAHSYQIGYVLALDRYSEKHRNSQ
ncbi:MAG: hypothetical protein ACYDBB_21290 [Armatimonadota bacterium]